MRYEVKRYVERVDEPDLHAQIFCTRISFHMYIYIKTLLTTYIYIYMTVTPLSVDHRLCCRATQGPNIACEK